MSSAMVSYIAICIYFLLCFSYFSHTRKFKRYSNKRRCIFKYLRENVAGDSRDAELGYTYYSKTTPWKLCCPFSQESLEFSLHNISTKHNCCVYVSKSNLPKARLAVIGPRPCSRITLWNEFTNKKAVSSIKKGEQAYSRYECATLGTTGDY